MAEPSPFAKSLRSPWQWAATAIVFILLFLGFIFYPALGTHNGTIAKQSPGLQKAYSIGLAMYAYANDNNGRYPTGKNSTEVFQKLIDEGYLTDGSILYDETLNAKGKVKATSNNLKPENVCWDVTAGLTTNSPDQIPLVFSTGFRVAYGPHGNATRVREDVWEGIAVFYRSNATSFAPEKTRGTVTNFIEDFPTDGTKYIQLTPDGPLP
jgi:hypothetical protein